MFPKYLYTVREVNFGEINGYDKHPDFTLVDSNGYIDIMEIKKPDKNQIIRKSKVRNNYVPQKIFTDVMVQASKYIDVLNKNGSKAKQSLINKLSEIYPDHTIEKENLYINNPKGIVLFGRSNDLNKEQLYDLELIKRQYKDITEIMTYDDLLTRINNLINALSNQAN